MSVKPTATQSINPTRHRSERLYARFNPGICVDHALSAIHKFAERRAISADCPSYAYKCRACENTRGCGGSTGNVNHL
jgi:hypothetical protein